MPSRQVLHDWPSLQLVQFSTQSTQRRVVLSKYCVERQATQAMAVVVNSVLSTQRSHVYGFLHDVQPVTQARQLWEVASR